MGTSQSGGGDASGAREFHPSDWADAAWRRGRASTSNWTLFEVAAMVGGFIIYWPVGLAVLGYKVYQGKMGAPDLQTTVVDKWRQARSVVGPWVEASNAARTRSDAPWNTARRAYTGTGNAAFDDWKAAELGRLEEERRKLDVAHREFADFLDHMRKARDREEFDRFMNERKKA